MLSFPFLLNCEMSKTSGATEIIQEREREKELKNNCYIGRSARKRDDTVNPLPNDGKIHIPRASRFSSSDSRHFERRHSAGLRRRIEFIRKVSGVSFFAGRFIDASFVQPPLRLRTCEFNNNGTASGLAEKEGTSRYIDISRGRGSHGALEFELIFRRFTSFFEPRSKPHRDAVIVTSSRGDIPPRFILMKSRPNGNSSTPRARPRYPRLERKEGERSAHR